MWQTELNISGVSKLETFADKFFSQVNVSETRTQIVHK